MDYSPDIFVEIAPSSGSMMSEIQNVARKKRTPILAWQEAATAFRTNDIFFFRDHTHKTA
ncbi:MAG: hypothetical protein Q4D62_03660 [Planctomycetia bacterium]|nr:hypothetical protein [Planctomycetia bacterium]